MELNRNHFFVMGIILIFLGIQLRYVESFVLNETSSRFVAKRLDWNGSRSADARPFPNLLSVVSPTSRRTVRPPRWVGWSLISVGAVFVLHSLVMRRPD